MPLLEIRFPAGRYHATLWGRHVNEGDPEWPPSPFRIARALADLWHRYFDGHIAKEDLNDALALLTGSPRYALPPAGRAVIKTYLHSNTQVITARQPVLDAFVTLPKSAVLYMELPQGTETAFRVLETLLSALNYLGRSESWVIARLVEQSPETCTWNCLPQSLTSQAHEALTVNLLRTAEDYLSLPYLPQHSIKVGKKTTTNALCWFDALCLSTKELFKQGWNRHPLLLQTQYAYLRESSPKSSLKHDIIRCVTYALHGNVLPQIKCTLPFAQRVRTLLMGKHRRIMGDNAALCSQSFSGKDADGVPLTGHKHACFWPLDLDNDGRIDHLRIHAVQAFDSDELEALYRLYKVWTPGKTDDIQLTLLHTMPELPVEQARVFISKTPVVFQRHWRKGRGSYEEWLRQEVRRACLLQGLPEPSDITLMEVEGHPLHWSNFIRARDGQVPSAGYGFRLEFTQALNGPFALGALAHYGLGLFWGHNV